MPWFRALIALLLSIAALSSYPVVIGQMLAPPAALPSAPGLSAADRAALAAPFQELANGQEQRLLAHVAPVLSQAEWAQSITQAHAALPPGRVQSSRLLNWSQSAGTDGARLSGVYEHVYPAHVVRSETILLRTGPADRWRVEGLHLDAATKAELEVNRFRLENRPPIFYGALALVALTPIFMLLTALAVLFSKALKLRWLWVLASVVGFCTFTMDSVTGVFSVTPLSFLIFGAGATWSGSAFEPWILSWSVPFGALAYWLVRPGKRKA
jgi:hypothetical protein